MDSEEEKKPEAEKPNALENYLGWYQGLQNPGFAVLVKGPWGVGKTFQVTTFLKERKHEYLYVSVYGLETVDQIHSAVLAEAAPVKGLEEISQAADKFAKSVVSSVTPVQLPDGMLSGFAQKWMQTYLDGSKTIIFDDLERSNISLKNLTGAINKYIEHYKCRVIVISHDEELQKKFSKLKEKIFGHEIRVEPQIEEALDFFLDELSSEYKKEIADYKDLIIKVFENSGAESLRILRRTVQDLERFYNIFKPLFSTYNEKNAFVIRGDVFFQSQELSNLENFLNDVIKEFLVFDVEFKNNVLTKSDLREYPSSFYKLIGNKEKNPSAFVIEKHGIYLQTGFFSSELLMRIFINGVYDEKEMRKSLNSLDFDNLPAWLKVVKCIEYPYGRMEKYLQEMNLQFDQREVTSPGEMLYIFALRLFLVEEKIFNRTLEEEKQLCLNYIQDLQKKDHHEFVFPSYIDECKEKHGEYVHYKSERTEVYFNEIFSALKKIYEENFKSYLKSDEFIEEILSSPHVTLSKYGHCKEIEFLCKVNPDLFVKKWLELPEDKRIIVSYCLKNHFDNLNESEYKNEFDWVKKVFRILKQEAAKKQSKQPWLAFLIRRLM